jgi:VanZ family protein
LIDRLHTHLNQLTPIKIKANSLFFDPFGLLTKITSKLKGLEIFSVCVPERPVMKHPKPIVIIIRICFGLMFLTATLLMLGPFQGAEVQFGLNDKAAHVIAFYGLTLMLMAVLPRIRSTDCFIIAIAFGGAIEVIQLFVGRSASVGDWAADVFGALLALLPVYVLRLRQATQTERRGEGMKISATPFQPKQY